MHDLGERAVCFGDGDGLVQTFDQLLVALAHHQADVADQRGLIFLDQTDLRIGALCQLVSDDRTVAKASPDAAQRNVAHHVGDRVVDPHFLEAAFLVEGIDEHRANLSTDDFTFQIVQRFVDMLVFCIDEQSFAI